MPVGTVDPRGRRYGDDLVTEVDEDVYEVPMTEEEGITLATALPPCIAMVPSIHIMTGQQPWLPCRIWCLLMRILGHDN